MYFNPLFALLKDDRKVVVYSDNTDEGTVTVFAVEDLPTFDVEFAIFDTVQATDVVRMDRDRAAAFA